MFTPQQVKARLREQPFRPLRIVTSSGQAYDVKHPDLVFVGRNDLIIGTASNDMPQFYDDVSRVALMHVTDLQDLPRPVPNPPGNGDAQTK
jgi:hypothetical protein